ncbi:Heme oxygenase [Granulicella pectinivorans]|uniref:Heme oxygenase n=1 Tax=Granulicella pectinivorans TaxID=474950 RepID=A0A1I6MR77_9BACT|nr:biliverdin-producing heme oxygenase [Granulicella pectinivorans]SFS18253.1 Heme oxygenase [Granulicella pectinivorans]
MRAATMEAHLSIERALALPDSIQTSGDYRDWLGRFFGIYLPLEEVLRGFHEWPSWKIDLDVLGQARALRQDLIALGCDLRTIELAVGDALPRLTRFAEALGALYVLEGSKLGGRMILRELLPRMSSEISGAWMFFEGHGAETGARWADFRGSLDAYCAAEPAELGGVIEGANATFQALHRWMLPLVVEEVA